ncbi:MAG TPA: hypothetical protein EYH24_06770 [Thermococcus paralvinellae]|uniref:Uncharacterized protein n=1 Tax=Thermococcus paralvinellae TaxID=582419 RepID=A0A832ZGB4_9EURY|nr:hypothetical protein [Thermococcus paralvinellae]
MKFTYSIFVALAVEKTSYDLEEISVTVSNMTIEISGLTRMYDISPQKPVEILKLQTTISSTIRISCLELNKVVNELKGCKCYRFDVFESSGK